MVDRCSGRNGTLSFCGIKTRDAATSVSASVTVSVPLELGVWRQTAAPAFTSSDLSGPDGLLGVPGFAVDQLKVSITGLIHIFWVLCSNLSLILNKNQRIQSNQYLLITCSVVSKQQASALKSGVLLDAGQVGETG